MLKGLFEQKWGHSYGKNYYVNRGQILWHKINYYVRWHHASHLETANPTQKLIMNEHVQGMPTSKYLARRQLFNMWAEKYGQMLEVKKLNVMTFSMAS